MVTCPCNYHQGGFPVSASGIDVGSVVQFRGDAIKIVLKHHLLELVRQCTSGGKDQGK